MKLRICPNCGKSKIGNANFCCWCGAKVPKNQDLDYAIMETGLEEMMGGIPFLSIGRFKCTEEDHQRSRVGMEVINQIMREEYLSGTKETLPTPMRYCRHCGKKLLD